MINLDSYSELEKKYEFYKKEIAQSQGILLELRKQLKQDFNCDDLKKAEETLHLYLREIN